MSDATTLSHEYEASASFAETVNQAVLRLKKGLKGRSDVTPQEVTEAKTKLAELLNAVAASLGATAGAQTSVSVPSDVLDRLAAKHSKRLSYFKDDLVETASLLAKNTPVDDEALEVLEEVCNAADATASESFRRLRRR